MAERSCGRNHNGGDLPVRIDDQLLEGCSKKIMDATLKSSLRLEGGELRPEIFDLIYRRNYV